MKLATKLAFVSMLAFASIASVVLLTGCGGGRVVVAQQPTPAPAAFAPAPAPSSVVVTTIPATPAPPAVATVIEPSPGPDYIRVEGYYNWVGDRYVWTAPTWTRVPRPGATYVPGHWQSTAGGYVWMPGSWQ